MGKLVRNGIDYSTPIVDSRLDTTSTNPVQNKVITAALNEKANTASLGTAAAKDVPTSGNASATQVVLGNDGRLAWMDTNGDIYFGATRIARVMDEDSYTALVSKDNIYYLTYPTPTNGRSLSVNLQNSGIDDMRDEPEEENEGISELEEPIEEEPIEENPPDDDMR